MKLAWEHVVMAPVVLLLPVVVQGHGNIRQLQDGTLNCNSIGCPDGFTPIPDARMTECSGECGTEQCCEAFCSYYACPNNYIPVVGAAEIQCDSECSTEQCCEFGSTGGTDEVEAGNTGGTEDVDAGTTSGADDVEAGITSGTDGVVSAQPEQGLVYCNSIGCPNGFTPIDEAGTTACTGDTCTTDQCCEAFCSYYACPNNYTPVVDADYIQCDSECSTEQCCDAPLVLCNSMGCPNGFTPIDEASTIECTGDTCTTEQCCEAFCSYYACPNNYTPVENADDIQCDSECSTELCCEFGNTGGTEDVDAGSTSGTDGVDADTTSGTDGVETEQPEQAVLLCNSIGCPNGFTPIDEAGTTACSGDTCTTDQCCEAFCSYYACPNNYIPVGNAAKIQCDSDCSTELCCDAGNTGGTDDVDAGTASGADGVDAGTTTSGTDDVDAGTTTRGTDGVGPGQPEQEAVLYCNSFACPNGFTPIDEAGMAECPGDTCTIELCCDAETTDDDIQDDNSLPVGLDGQEYSGKGTYYGGTTGGNCAFGADVPGQYSDMIPVALNEVQYGDSLMCGACIEGTGDDGLDFQAYVTDKCPGAECAEGTLDFQGSGDGVFDITWRFVACPGNDGLSFISPSASAYYMKVQPRGTKTPVESLTIDGFEAVRTDDNHFVVQDDEGGLTSTPTIKTKTMEGVSETTTSFEAFDEEN